MTRLRKKVLDYLEYLAVRLGETIIRTFDLRFLHGVCAWIGDMMYRFDRRHRNRAMEHLRRSFPDRSEKELCEIARLSMRSLFYLGLEVMFTTRKIGVENWRRSIQFKDVGLAIKSLLEHETGFIFVTGHFGNWEAVGYAMAVLGFPSVAVARGLDNPYVNEHLMGVREKTGQSILYKKHATRTMHEVLEARGTLSFIADQDAGPKGIFVDFLGRQASTYRSVGLMVMEHEVPVAVGYGMRIGERYMFEMGIERIIYPREWKDKADPLRWITQEYTSALERVIRRAPDQYIWTHRRWKTRPEGEQSGPDGIA